MEGREIDVGEGGIEGGNKNITSSPNVLPWRYLSVVVKHWLCW